MSRALHIIWVPIHTLIYLAAAAFAALTIPYAVEVSRQDHTRTGTSIASCVLVSLLLPRTTDSI